jgi:hypothetical protein
MQVTFPGRSIPFIIQLLTSYLHAEDVSFLLECHKTVLNMLRARAGHISGKGDVSAAENAREIIVCLQRLCDGKSDEL